MRNSLIFLVAVTALAFTGCAGPEQKLGRGLNNLTSFVHGGEMRRSIEQTALWDGADSAYTTGFIRGFNRSLARTAIGAYEVLTFPLPSYNPMFASRNKNYPDNTIKNRSYPFGGMVLSENPDYPDSFKPGLFADSIFATDTSLGFSGGDVAPMIPGSRFHIFDN